MAALLGGRLTGKSQADVKYTELPQHISDEDDAELYDEEDDLLFVRSANGLQNGNASAHNKKKTGRYKQGEVIELGNLGGSPIKATRIYPKVEVRRAVFARKCFFVFAICGVFVFVIALAIGIPAWNLKGAPIAGHVTKLKNDWSRRFDSFGSEACVRLVHVDEDDTLDILLGMGLAVDLDQVDNYDLESYCKKKGRSFPCEGVVVALRGTDGVELWRMNTLSAVFLMNCEEVDVNKDGKTDCILSGRKGTLLAIDPRNGEALWRSDSTSASRYLKREWNMYQASALPDFDGDGVPEIVVAHGGEPKFSPLEKNRNAGRLILISGATGKPIGEYLDMPDKKETYMTSVMYTFPDGAQYILFGTGGETIPGNFLAISVPDFYRHSKKLARDGNVPNVKGDYSHWSQMDKDEKGIITIYKGKTKGIMVPPVLVDMNNDGISDILMTAFEGTLVLFDGKNLQQTWKQDLPGYEAYSTPSPGYFNADDTIDFMQYWNKGVWPAYDMSVAMMFSGKNGSILWSTSSSQYNMASPLVMRTSQANKDIFVLRMVGRTGTKLPDINGVIHGIGAQRIITKRHNPGGKKNKKLPEPAQNTPNSYNRIPGYNTHGKKAGPRNYKPAQTRFRGQPTLPNLGSEKQPGDWRSQQGRGRERESTPPPDISQVDEGSMGAAISDRTSRPPTGREQVMDFPQQASSTETEENTDTEFEKKLTCDSDLTSVTAETFLFDRTTATRPLKMCEKMAEPHNYTFNDEDREMLMKSLNMRSDGPLLTKLAPPVLQNTLGNFCTVLQSDARTTGAIADVDGDGKLDLVVIDGMMGLLTDRDGSYVRSYADTVLTKVTLELGNHPSIPLKVMTSPAITVKVTSDSPTSFNFLDYAQQKWTQYLGKKGNSVYT